MSGIEEPDVSGRLDSPGEPVPAPSGFVLLAECGRGAMGLVYLAEQIGLGRHVALKFLKPELASSDEERARFRTEAMALARLQHPNIVQVFDCGTHEGRAYIVQEYVSGGNLEEKIARKPQPAIPAALLVATLARAVAHAHAQKIIHRDLKPSNILLTAEGVPKISDFGLARQIDAGTDSGQTRSGIILGSPSYMAPEQTIGKHSVVGPAVDVYALGAILYEMLTGRPPFLAASVIETLEAVRQSEPVPPRQLQSVAAARPGDDLSEMPGESAGTTLSLGRGSRRRPRSIRPWAADPRAAGLGCRATDEMGSEASRHSGEPGGRFTGSDRTARWRHRLRGPPPSGAQSGPFERRRWRERKSRIPTRGIVWLEIRSTRCSHVSTIPTLPRLPGSRN